MNLVILHGNLTRDPQLRYTPNGKAVCELGIAINDGKDQTTFVDVQLWEKQAELAAEYLTKGRGVIIERARLRNESWTDKDTGQKRSKLAIVGERFKFVGNGGSRERSDDTPSNAPSGPPSTEPMDDDVPF